MTTTNTIRTIAAGLAAVAVAALFLLSSSVAATDPAPVRAGLRSRLQSLGLTADQKAEIKGILRKYQPSVGPMVRQLVAARRSLRDTIRAETVDETAVRAQAAKVASLEADLAVQRAHIAHEIRAVLTPEQIQQFGELQGEQDGRVDARLSRVAKRLAAD